ncbi:tetratricopeptide repeat protein [Flavivirga amylovorans]|uniref:histidine kinase n=1 Tax=Flavivirga amylovorans TaxID=870486 RepID=A0ABT8X3Z1_9FLAO|nr:tetratricopeptide repeat protein [Flavivirga amylovorans]MDO5988663.1 tetratricopeptide repeat protein [Flavivirga amylovorans]
MKPSIWLFFLFFCVQLTAQTDSLEQKLVEAPIDEKVNIYIELTNKYSKINVDKAIGYAKQGLELVKEKNNKDTGFFYLRLGYLHNYKSEHSNALFYYEKALEVAKHMEYELGIGKSYQNIGVTHVKMGNYDKALDYDLKALSIYEKNNENNFVTGIVANIGSLYSCRLNDHENGLLYYNRALELSKEVGNEEFRSYVLGAVAELYVRQEEYEKAKSTLKESIEIAEKLDYLKVVVSGFSNLSQINIKENKFKEALVNSKKALKMCLELGYTEENTSLYLTLANIYEQLGDVKSAELHYEEALSVALKSKVLPQLSNVYQALYQYTGRKKSYKESYEYLLKYNTIKDSLLDKEKDKQFKEIQAKFDLENKEKEIQLLTNENRIKALENQNQRTSQVILIIGMIALIIIILTLFYAYKNKQKSHTTLTEKNKVISQTLKDREILFKEVHHRVKNNLQIVSSLLRLQYKFGNHKKSQEIIQEVQDKIQAMSIIHERLYKSSDLSLINFKTYLDNLLTYFKTSYNLPEQNITVTTAIDNIELDMDYLVPCGLIVNEIIANSIKYAFHDNSGGNINIEASKSGDQCILKIQDTGVGFPNGFNVHEAKSLGIMLIRGLTKQINGTVKITSNSGACYNIVFNVT